LGRLVGEDDGALAGTFDGGGNGNGNWHWGWDGSWCWCWDRDGYLKALLERILKQAVQMQRRGDEKSLTGTGAGAGTGAGTGTGNGSGSGIGSGFLCPKVAVS
tara:strand:- start:493 stop:801 length:309 start_codon:yes stop_codon:yes gene_type:complete